MNKPSAYIDAAPIIDLVKYRVGVGIDSAREKDAWCLQQLLVAARAGEVDLFTSALTIAECTHVEDQSKLDIAKPFFLQLLQSGRSGIRLIQPVQSIIEEARNLRWTHGIVLKGVDAIHAASAMKFRCDEFLHRDGKIGGASGSFLSLGIRVCAPSDTLILPGKFRQQGLSLSAPQSP